MDSNWNEHLQGEGRRHWLESDSLALCILSRTSMYSCSCFTAVMATANSLIISSSLFWWAAGEFQKASESLLMTAKKNHQPIPMNLWPVNPNFLLQEVWQYSWTLSVLTPMFSFCGITFPNVSLWFLTSGKTFLHIQIGRDTIQAQYRPHISILFQENRMEECIGDQHHTLTSILPISSNISQANYLNTAAFPSC